MTSTRLNLAAISVDGSDVINEMNQKELVDVFRTLHSALYPVSMTQEFQKEPMSRWGLINYALHHDDRILPKLLYAFATGQQSHQ